MDIGLMESVTPEQIEQIRPRLVEFAEQMLGELPRSDQRAKGELYVRGLLTDGARKSMQPMAERLGLPYRWEEEKDRPRLLRMQDPFG